MIGAMKECKACGIVNPLDEFHAKSGMKDGHINQCKECIAKYHKAYAKTEAGNAAHKKAKKKYQESEEGKKAKKKYGKSEKGKDVKNKYRINNPQKRKAQSAVQVAIKNGSLTAGPCEICEDTKEEKKIEGHHDDYAKPLEVRWLCRQCHADWHKENGSGIN